MQAVTATIAQYGTAIAMVSVFIVGYLAGNFERKLSQAKAAAKAATGSGASGFNPFNQEIMQDFARLKALESRARKAMYLFDCWCVSGKPDSYPVQEEMAVEIGQAFMGALTEDEKGE